MKIALVTSILGHYDILKDISHFNGFDAYCFTDQHFDNSFGWNVVPINKKYSTIDERVRLCREIKIRIFDYLPNYDIWIWSDSSLTWKVNPLETIQYLGNSSLATFKYNKRECIYEEAEACIQRGKDREEVILNHMSRYEQEYYPKKYGLVETTLVVRKNDLNTIRFCNLWWSELESGSRRDQLSFNYVSWKTGIPFSFLPGYRLNNPFADWLQHSEIIYNPKSIATVC